MYKDKKRMKNMNKKLFFILFAIVCCFSQKTVAFDNLNQIKIYAQKKEEFPKLDNTNLLKPDYSSFHIKETPTFFEKGINKILSFLQIKKQLWSPEYFKNLLEKVTKKRELNAYRDDFIIKTTPPIGSKYIIFGDLQGAFHSFVRILDKLKQFGIINNKLKIIKSNYHFIFNGDLIDRSPFILETITLALKLLEQNPGKVFYIKGNHEHKHTWYDYGLRKELEIRCKSVSDEPIPLSSLMLRFFNTLPLALYLKSKIGVVDEFVQISHYGRTFKILDETYFSEFLYKNDFGTLQTFNLENKESSIIPAIIKVIIKSESRSTIYQFTDGLRLLDSDKGATAWTILSCPTTTYKKLFGFYYDAYAELTVGGRIKDWTIALYNQRLNTHNKFEMKKFLLTSGKKIYENFSVQNDKKYYHEQIIDLKRSINGIEYENNKLKNNEQKINTVSKNKENQINIGCTADLSKGSKYLTAEFLHGLRLAINKQNKIGGINGQFINFIVLDDEYTSKKTISQLEKIQKKYKTNIFLGSTGSPTVVSLIPKIVNDEIIMLFPYTGSTLLRNKNLKNIIHARSSYASESFTLINSILPLLKKKKIAIFYQDDEFGLEAVVGARAILKKHNIQELCLAPYERNTINIETAVENIKKFNPEAILFISVKNPTITLINHLGAQYLAGKILLGVSDMKAMKIFFEQQGLEITCAQGLPNFNNIYIELIREYQEDNYRTGKKRSDLALEGYVVGNMFIRLLKEINGPITKKSIMNIIENKKSFFFKGLSFYFNPETRSFLDNVWLETKDGTWLENQLSKESLTAIQKEYALLQKQKKGNLKLF